MLLMIRIMSISLSSMVSGVSAVRAAVFVGRVLVPMADPKRLRAWPPSSALQESLKRTWYDMAFAVDIHVVVFAVRSRELWHYM
jgi:hypothetical protein